MTINLVRFIILLLFIRFVSVLCSLFIYICTYIHTYMHTHENETNYSLVGFYQVQLLSFSSFLAFLVLLVSLGFMIHITNYHSLLLSQNLLLHINYQNL